MSKLKELLLESNVQKQKNKVKVSSNPQYNDLMLKKIPNYIEATLKTTDFSIKPSVGQTNYANIPWICILSKKRSISPSAQKGLYIVILFHKSGRGFYLCLSQGFTNFEQMQITELQRDQIIQNTVDYFQHELDNKLFTEYSFSKEKITLGEKLTRLAKGYVKTTIVSKYYDFNTFDEIDFFESLHTLIQEYKNIIEHIGNKTYDEVLTLINPSHQSAPLEKALEQIDHVLKTEF